MEAQQYEKELARAKKALLAANKLFEEELYEDSVSRTYYAVLHAAKAVLATLGIEPESHDAVRRLFGLYLVKSGKIEKEFSKILTAEYEDRDIADYAADIEIGKERAELRGRQAEKFIQRIEKYLEENKNN